MDTVFKGIDFSKESVLEMAQKYANDEDTEVIAYPEPGLGENAWDFIESSAFEKNGYERVEEDVLIKPDLNKTK